MKKRFWILMLLLVAGGALARVFLLRSEPEVLVGNISIPVTVADTPSERELGHSGTPYLPENSGKLFIFEGPSRPGFWMKDMLFPIDIVWISEDWKIVDLSENLTPDTYPKTFTPSSDVRFVLEVNSGFSSAHNLKIGQSLVFKK